MRSTSAAKREQLWEAMFGRVAWRSLDAVQLRLRTTVGVRNWDRVADLPRKRLAIATWFPWLRAFPDWVEELLTGGEE